MFPRKYQTDAIDFAVSALAEKKRALIQLPTGTGKSLVLLRIAGKWIRSGNPVYVIAPTDQAVFQLHQTARRLGLFACLDTRERKAPNQAKLVITTYSCAWRRYRRRVKPNTLVLIDECHHVNFKAPVNLSILNSFQSAIGLSATPWSKGCLEYFDANLFRYKLSQAIAEGMNSQFEISPWSDPQKGKYQIIYTNDGDYRAELCRALPQSDYAIYKRAKSKIVISRFRHGLVGTIIVNRMLTEGFDLPQIKRVWIARESHSRIALMQMAGRSLRPFQNQKAIIYTGSPEVHRLLKRAIHKAG